MSLTTDSDPPEASDAPSEAAVSRPDPSAVASKFDQSGYDVVTSAASPHSVEVSGGWTKFVLFNVLIPILLIGVGVLILFVWTQSPEPPPTPSADVSRASFLQRLKEVRVERIRSLEETGQRLELVTDGTVVPFREALVSSEVAGRVVEKNCETGDLVNRGDVLIKIDAQDYQLEVQRLEKQLDSEDKSLAEADQEVDNTSKSIELAEEDVALRQKEVDRQQSLERKTFASATEVERADGALLQAKQQLVTLQNQRDLLTKRRAKLVATKELVIKQLELARLNLERCVVRAPISGVVVTEQVDTDAFANRGTPLVVIEDTSKVEVAANMRMDQLHWVLDQETTTRRSGYELPPTEALIEFEISGRQGIVQRWKGQLVSYDGIGIDPNTRTVPVRLLVDNPTENVDGEGRPLTSVRPNALVRGMYVRVRLRLDPKPGLVVIPANALRPGNRVWKFAPNDDVVDREIEEFERQAAERKLATAERSTQNESAEPPAIQADSSGGASDAHADSPDDITAVSKFDADQWSAGTVGFSSAVYPIELLRTGADSASKSLIELPQETEIEKQRYWICEPGPLDAPEAKKDLVAGDYVVVSAINLEANQQLRARAEIKK